MPVGTEGNSSTDSENTAQILYLGNPFAEESRTGGSFARNVWDMQLWEGKIYLGYGYADNAVLVFALYYDPTTGVFQPEFLTNDSVIYHFEPSGNQLYFVGYDPVNEEGGLGDFYRRSSTGWERVHTVPVGSHTFDIIEYQDTLFVATVGIIYSSVDKGQTWSQRYSPRDTIKNLFLFGDELFAFGFSELDPFQRYTIYRYRNNQFVSVPVDFFPSASYGQYGRKHGLGHITHLGETLLYIGVNDLTYPNFIPFAAYKASQIDQSQHIDLPATDVPYDITVRDGRAYILTNRFALGATEVSVVIYGSDDLESWREIAQFTMPSFARSFEYYEGKFYIGLGTLLSPRNEASGSVYQVTP